jgi:hypothetical protein
MPSVLVSDDRADVESALASKPRFTDQQSIALYNWCFRLITALFNYVSYFLGDNSDRTDDLIRRVQALEEQSQVPQPQQTIPQSTIPQQPSRPSSRRRCKRCHAIGHDTNECRTKDPIAIKKRVTNNQKARKKLDQDPPLSGTGPSLHPSNSSVHFSPYGPPTDSFGNQMFYNRSSSTYEAFTALAVDAKELRRRKVQSARDKRRRGATSTTATNPSRV